MVIQDARLGAGRRRVLVLGTLAGLIPVLLAGAAAPAAATVTDRSRVTTPYAYESWDCGYPIDVVGVTHDQLQTRVDARTGVPFITDNFDGRETWTASDGRWFTRSWHGIAKDIRARSLGGSPWTFTNRQAGQPVVITDAQGAVVARDRGSLTQTLTIDVRDGSVVDVQVRVAGPHPMLGFTNP
jgi:hypothetical protein